MPQRANLETRIAVTLSLSNPTPRDSDNRPPRSSGPMSPVSETTQPAASSCGNPAATRGRESRALCSPAIDTFQNTAPAPSEYRLGVSAPNKSGKAVVKAANSARNRVFWCAFSGAGVAAGVIALVRHRPLGTRARAP